MDNSDIVPITRKINIHGVYEGDLKFRSVKPRTKHGIGNKDKFATIDIQRMFEDRLKEFKGKQLILEVIIKESEFKYRDYNCMDKLKKQFVTIEDAITEIKRSSFSDKVVYKCEYCSNYHVGAKVNGTPKYEVVWEE